MLRGRGVGGRVCEERELSVKKTGHANWTREKRCVQCLIAQETENGSASGNGIRHYAADGEAVKEISYLAKMCEVGSNLQDECEAILPIAAVPNLPCALKKSNVDMPAQKSYHAVTPSQVITTSISITCQHYPRAPRWSAYPASPPSCSVVHVAQG